MKPKRLSLILVMMLTLSLGVTSAHAAKPIRGCPPVFRGPLAFATILTLYPPP